VSLINEALKRTRDASYQSGNIPPAVAPSYRFNDSAESTVLSLKGGIALTILILTIAIGTVSFIVFRRVAPAQAVNEAFVSNLPDNPPPATQPTANVQPAPVTPAQPVPAAPAPPKEPPKLVLQGITIDGAAREAMINGYTLREGEDIEGARIVAIESRRVRLQFDDREIVLRVP
jgi:hypothetical protein